jgi:hypothetical protein
MENDLDELREKVRAIAERAHADSEFREALRSNPTDVLTDSGIDVVVLEEALNRPPERALPGECRITCFNPWPTIRCTSISVLV